ncbi:MAG: GNAT family N-acetyltransferase [candidate division KSB1 bacterium]|nr:GNAT family N-acetyltransferase [candidate division KSB1 bacterium]MDZ7333964.1 GNAT family N-acetyltransferase [candidate division KSB1 bacterium]MDZ7356760.1 GNAT family N-acetyltransferase [candidate division KSB1 bacterium]MDZ7375382.1 GNAT family N-acetyltransferase [candidate division KSB1 bacterium]MDZ7399949.1 GNAT family N-acetyltransferase [candidate division KSB1 bacterium]
MANFSKMVKLKDDTNVLLRLMVESDLDQLCEFYRSIPESDRLFLRIDVTDRGNVERRFGRLNYDIVYPILALVDNRIIGIATLFRAEFGWKRNLGEVRVLIAPEFQRKGLATIFIRELFFHALKAKIYKLQAEMIDNQESAIAAFERLGFREEARLKKHVTDIRGRRRDLVIMTLDIEDFWYLIEDFVESRDFRIH